ncbi:MAG TPA: proline racemase family protein [Saprospiraceae bacterium]|nr:proline racemase family protein [Saprospiraceae bacterium]
MNTYQKILKVASRWSVDFPEFIQTIDMHTGGEPLRIILNGFPPFKGQNVLEIRNDIASHYDHLRKLLMWEPRGHADMYGCILTPPNDKDADFGVVFLHNAGYSTMCGHAIIALSELIVRMKCKEPENGVVKLTIDAPCGRIFSKVIANNGHSHQVIFQGVPSYVTELDLVIQVSTLGRVVCDIAYGGAFYAYVDMRKNRFPFQLVPEHLPQIIDMGMKIKRAVNKSALAIKHPYEPDLEFLYGTIFIDDAHQSENHSRNVCVFADGEVDRCPTGSGLCGRLAIHEARGEVLSAERITIESITGSVFTGSYVQSKDFGSFHAVLPHVEGRASITGFHQFVLEKNDPFPQGFLLRG